MNPVKKFAYEYIIPIVGKVFRSKNKFVNVIYYHDIVKEGGNSFMKTNIDVFKRQMEYIAAKGYETLRFDDLQDVQKVKGGAKKIIIAFDDGWLSNYNEIYDMMESLGLKYNIYLTIGEISANPEYLTWDLVRKMHSEGLVGFGAHTYTHPDMSDISKVDANLEFNKADEVFERELGYKPVDFCYPFGKYSESSNEYISSNLGYQRIYTSRLMYSYCQNGKIIFGRNSIHNDEPFRVFKAKLNGYYNIWRNLIG